MQTKIDKQTADRIILWLMDNSRSGTSEIRGKTPSELGYTKDNYKKIELGFEETYGSDLITVFFQKDEDGKGKSFKVSNIDDALWNLLHEFYLFKRKDRESINSISDILNHEPKVIKEETTTQEDQMLLDYVNN